MNNARYFAKMYEQQRLANIGKSRMVRPGVDQSELYAELRLLLSAELALLNQIPPKRRSAEQRRLCSVYSEALYGWPRPEEHR